MFYDMIYDIIYDMIIFNDQGLAFDAMGDIVLFLMPLWVGKNSHLIYKDLPQGSTVPLLIY